MNKVFVFRIANDSDFVQRELRNGRLRQGWGSSTTNLLSVGMEEWVATQCARDQFPNNETYYRQKYKNLSLMLEIGPDDILIVPKAPTVSQFTICRASGTYRFEAPNGYDGDDFRHLIPVRPDSLREFNYHAGEDTKVIYAKLHAYQSPLNHVWNETVQSAANRLMEAASKPEPLSTEDLVTEMKASVLRKSALQRFRNLGHRETEDVVKLVFERLQYECIGRNSYDREGGDADLIFRDNSMSEFLDVGVNSNEIVSDIYVQIKNKDGKDGNDTEGVKQLNKRTRDIPGCTKILVSTADHFSEECKKLANQSNVLLIDGLGLLKLVFRYID